MNTSGWGLREDNVCRDSSDGYWPKGKKLMEFHWPMANCTVLHNQINVLSLFSPFTSLWRTFNAQTCSRWGTERRGSTWKRWQMCEKLRGSSGLLVSAFDLQDWRTASQGFSCCSIFLLRLQRECKNWRDSVMWRILHRCCICFSRSDRHFVFMLLTCRLYVLWPRSPVVNIWLNPSGWFAIVNIVRTSVSGQNPRRTTGTTKMMSVFHVCCREKSESQAWSWEQQRSLMSQAFVWSINSSDHILMFSVFLVKLNMC